MCREVSEGENTFWRHLVTWLVFTSYLCSHIASAMSTQLLRLVGRGCALCVHIRIFSDVQ